MFACAEQHWRNCQVHFVDETLLEILSNSRHPATEPYIFVTGRCPRRSQRSVPPISLRPALSNPHSERRLARFLIGDFEEAETECFFGCYVNIRN
jgi:hypothetical protein